MPYLKKLVFAIPFLIFFFLFCLNLDFFLKNSNFLFSFNIAEIIQLILLIFYLLLSSTFFAIFITLASDWRFILSVIILASFIPFFLSSSSVYILIFGFFIAFLITFFFLQKKLKNYLTFQASTLLIPSTKFLATLIILVSSLVFYLNISQSLVKTGFQIPDSLLDPIIKMSSSSLSSGLPQGPGPMLDIPADQINLLKQNPDLLKQYGLDPKILDQVNITKSSSINQNDLIKGAVNSQIQSLIGPNIKIVAIILAVIFFLSLNFLASFLALLLYPIISLIFWILEKSGFTKFEVTQREVKKLII